MLLVYVRIPEISSGVFQAAVRTGNIPEPPQGPAADGGDKGAPALEAWRVSRQQQSRGCLM